VRRIGTTGKIGMGCMLDLTGGQVVRVAQKPDNLSHRDKRELRAGQKLSPCDLTRETCAFTDPIILFCCFGGHEALPHIVSNAARITLGGVPVTASA